MTIGAYSLSTCEKALPAVDLVARGGSISPNSITSRTPNTCVMYLQSELEELTCAHAYDSTNMIVDMYTSGQLQKIEMLLVMEAL